MTPVQWMDERDLLQRAPAAMAVVMAVAGIGGTVVERDVGTSINRRADLRSFERGTRLTGYVPAHTPFAPFVQPTRMQRIQQLSGLSRRELGEILGVSHTMVGRWLKSDPEGKPELTKVLSALEEAGRYHVTDLKSWLTRIIPGTELRPVDLLRDKRWRAFKGAVRTRRAPASQLSPAELFARRQAEVSWAIAEPEIPSEA